MAGARFLKAVMEFYADPSFLWTSYAPRANSAAALDVLKTFRPPRPLVSLQRFEFTSSVCLAIFRAELGDGDRQLAGVARQVLVDFEADLANGTWLVQRAPMEAVFARACALSEAHTVAHGKRSMDVLHVAAALELRAAKFYTFDLPQRRLARAAGLDAPDL